MTEAADNSTRRRYSTASGSFCSAIIASRQVHSRLGGAIPCTRTLSGTHRSGNAGSQLAHLDAAPAPRKVTQPQRDSRRRRRPHLRQQDKLLTWCTALHNSLVVDDRWPRSDGMQNASAGCRPRRIHRTDPTVADHPARVRPAVGQHVPDSLTAGGDISCHGHR